MSFSSAVAEVSARLGRWNKQVLAREVLAAVDAETYQSKTWPAWVAACVKEATQEGDHDLPRAASVDNAGTYVQQELWGPEDFQVIAERYISQGAAHLEKARKVASLFTEVYGSDLDVDAMWAARSVA